MIVSLRCEFWAGRFLWYLPWLAGSFPVLNRSYQGSGTERSQWWEQFGRWGLSVNPAKTKGSRCYYRGYF